MNELIIQMQDVAKIYSTGAGDFEALKGITLDVNNWGVFGHCRQVWRGKDNFVEYDLRRERNIVWRGLVLAAK